MTGKSWLITGGSSGIGLSLGRHVLKNNATAILTTRNISKAQSAAPDIESSGGHWLQLDYADPNLEKTLKDAVSKWNIDVLVNNAAYAQIGAIEDCSIDTIRAQYESNIFGPLKLIQAIVPIFRERGTGGTIANIGSSISYSSVPGTLVYSSTKSAIRTLTEGLALELSPFSIRVLLFEPGQFRTNFGANAAFTPPSKLYETGPVANTLAHLKGAPLKPGDPDKAACRIWDVVRKEGMWVGEGGEGKEGKEGEGKEGKGLEGICRIPLGSDVYKAGIEHARKWEDVMERTVGIAKSTDF